MCAAVTATVTAAATVIVAGIPCKSEGYLCHCCALLAEPDLTFSMLPTLVPTLQVALKEPVPASTSTITSTGGLAPWLVAAVTSAVNAPSDGQPSSSTAAASTAQAVAGPSADVAGGGGSLGIGSSDQRLMEATAYLTRALQLLVADAGCCPELLQECLLEATHLTSAMNSTSSTPPSVAEGGGAGESRIEAANPAAAVAAAQLAVLLQLARSAALKHEALIRSPQEVLVLPAGSNSSTAGPVLVGSLPSWVVEWVTQQESYSQQQQRVRETGAAAAASSGGLFGGGAEPSSSSSNKRDPSPTKLKAGAIARGAAGGGGADDQGQEQQAVQLNDALIGRLVVQQYLELMRYGVGGLAKSAASSRGNQKLLLLHQALKKAWPQLEADYCKHEVPQLPMTAGVAPPPPGVKLCQCCRYFHNL